MVLASRVDNIEHINEKFTYDNLDRLSSWNLTSSKLNKQREYRYDIYGNMVYKSNVGEFGFNAKNQIVTAPSKLGFFNYDANGNMLNGNNKEYVYNKANQVVRIEYNKHRAYEEYLYDESENIIRTNNSKGELSYKLGDYEVTYRREQAKDNVYMYHRIFANGNQVALHIKHLINEKKQVDRTLYFHKDNLGSTLLTTDNMARVVNRDLYAPYGEKINLKKDTNIYKGVLDNRLPGFTGHNTIEGANVIVMKSRVYDPVIARFTSPDTIVPDVNSALGFNRYAYVYNNPLKYVDPDGHFPFLFFLGAAIFTVGATSDNAIVHTLGTLIGGLMMGNALHGAFDNAFLEGATRSFTQSVLSGGDISQIFTNTITGGLNAQITSAMPGMFGLDHDQFSLGLMLGHGAVQGLFSAIRGGKFKTGFISGMASKGISAIMRGTSLSKSDPFVKMTITAVLSGMVSKASGGDFVQGAMSAMVVWLYNDFNSLTEKEKQAILKKFHEGDKPLVSTDEFFIPAGKLVGTVAKKLWNSLKVGKGAFSKGLVKSKYFGMGSKLFGNSRIRTGLLNNQNSKIPVKIGWSQPVGGGGYIFRIGLGRMPGSNMARWHMDFKSTFQPYEVTDQIVNMLRGTYR